MRRLPDRLADFGGASAPTHGMLAVHLLSSPPFCCIGLSWNTPRKWASIVRGLRKSLGAEQPIFENCFVMLALVRLANYR